MDKRISRIIGLIMIIAAIGFVCYALMHPEASFIWPNWVSYILYAAYMILTVFFLIAPFENRK